MIISGASASRFPIRFRITVSSTISVQVMYVLTQVAFPNNVEADVKQGLTSNLSLLNVR